MTPFEFGRFIKLSMDPAGTHTELSYKPSNNLGGRTQLISPVAPNAQSAARTSSVVPRYRKPDSGNIWSNAERGEAMQIITKPHGGRTQPYMGPTPDGLIDIKDPAKDLPPQTVDT